MTARTVTAEEVAAVARLGAAGKVARASRLSLRGTDRPALPGDRRPSATDHVRLVDVGGETRLHCADSTNEVTSGRGVRAHIGERFLPAMGGPALDDPTMIPVAVAGIRMRTST